MRRRPDALSVLEAAYAFEADEQVWMQRIVDAMQSYDVGHGVGGYVAELGATIGVRSVVAGKMAYCTPENVLGVSQVVSPDFWRWMHSPSPIRLNYDLAVAAARREGIDPAIIVPALSAQFQRAPEQALCWGVSGGDPGVESVILCVACRSRHDLPNIDIPELNAIGAHVGAAFRLRARLGGRPSPDSAETEAVLTPSGKLLHATSAAAKRLRTSLTEAVQGSERARSRKAYSAERLALWTALVEGMWSIVESVDRDGKRFLLACRNEPRVAPFRRMTPREVSVVQFVALGHSYKYIAYELGLSISAVALALKQALRKVGLASRSDLIRTFGGLGLGHRRPIR